MELHGNLVFFTMFTKMDTLAFPLHTVRKNFVRGKCQNMHTLNIVKNYVPHFIC